MTGGHRDEQQNLSSHLSPPKDPIALPGSLTFNTVITKLKAGKQIFSNTITDPDLGAAKEACAGQDFIWIEMQQECHAATQGDRHGRMADHQVGSHAQGERIKPSLL